MLEPVKQLAGDPGVILFLHRNELTGKERLHQPRPALYTEPPEKQAKAQQGTPDPPGCGLRKKDGQSFKHGPHH